MNAKLMKIVNTVVRNYLPAIETVIAQHVTPKLKKLVTDDKELSHILRLSYKFIPLPVRIFLSEDKYVAFILAKKAVFVRTSDSSVAAV